MFDQMTVSANFMIEAKALKTFSKIHINLILDIDGPVLRLHGTTLNPSAVPNSFVLVIITHMITITTHLITMIKYIIT